MTIYVKFGIILTDTRKQYFQPYMAERANMSSGRVKICNFNETHVLFDCHIFWHTGYASFDEHIDIVVNSDMKVDYDKEWCDIQSQYSSFNVSLNEAIEKCKKRASFFFQK